MNMSKSKVWWKPTHDWLYVNNTQINIYLGQRYSTRYKNQDKEIQRRITAGWTAFTKHRDIFKGNIGICLKRQIYNSCVLPAMTYGAETYALTTHAKNKHKQRWKGKEMKRPRGRPARRFKRWTRWLLEGYHLAEDSARQADVKAACWGLRPTTGHYGCTTMMMMMMMVILNISAYSILCRLYILFLLRC